MKTIEAMHKEIREIFEHNHMTYIDRDLWNKLEQKYSITEDKHQALLNNCTDNDEAILHKKEIEGAKGWMDNKEAIDFLEEIKLFLITKNFFEQLGISEKKKVADRNIKRVIELLQRGEAYKKKAERLEIIILDYSLWLKANHKTMKIKDAAIYWKKLVEDYVFEGVKKVIVALSKATEKGAK